ncbi:MAG: exonuclease [Ruminococcaceae bacterium]|jgi:DNA polymerase III, epsilon subunit and related 3''-5'' exonucleases|nr:exonuclease [Oscillospiraceae bacterium]
MASYRYIAFDVETPNRYNDRMSAIGITVVEDGRIVGEHYTPVNPETFFDDFNTRLTGLDQDAVRGAPTFPELWQQIAPVFESGLLVAHNAVFDLGVLKKCLRDYEIPWRRYARYLCTVQMGRRLLPGIGHRLNEMCCYYNIPLSHHHAGSDSRACAEILLRYFRSGADPKQFIRTYSLI